jgi:hypothetical protein
VPENRHAQPLPAFFLVVAAISVLISSALVGAFQDAGAAAVWKDRETRTAYSSDRNETTIFFALLPSCALGSPTLTFAATFHGKAVTIAPGAVEVRADLGTLHVSPNFMRTRTLKFLLDRSTPAAATMDVSANLHSTELLSPGGTLHTATVNMDLADFIQLVSAHAIGIDVFGVECSLDANQMAALRSFATQIVPPLRQSVAFSGRLPPSLVPSFGAPGKPAPTYESRRTWYTRENRADDDRSCVHGPADCERRDIVRK